jgi:hypothetical protein
MQCSVIQLVHLASTVRLLAALCQILVALQFGVSILNHGFTQYPSRDLTGRKHSCLRLSRLIKQVYQFCLSVFFVYLQRPLFLLLSSLPPSQTLAANVLPTKEVKILQRSMLTKLKNHYQPALHSDPRREQQICLLDL